MVTRRLLYRSLVVGVVLACTAPVMAWNPSTHHTKLNRAVRIATKVGYLGGLPIVVGLGAHFGAQLVMGPQDIVTYADMSKELLPNLKQHLASVAAQSIPDPAINPDLQIPGESGKLYPFEEIRGLEPEQAIGRMKDYVNGEAAGYRNLPAFTGWFSAQLITGFSMMSERLDKKIADITDRVTDAMRPQVTSSRNRSR